VRTAGSAASRSESSGGVLTPLIVSENGPWRLLKYEVIEGVFEGSMGL
jgi:hypothetical protein